MRYIQLILAIGVVFLISCQKREEKTFTVKVYNPVTGEPYSDIYVAVLERPNTTDGYVTESTTFLEGYTNASGELRLTGEFHVRYAYDLITSTPGGVTICNTESRHNDLKSNVILHLDDENLEGSEAYVELTPCAQLKFKLKNINCQNGNDLLEVYFDGSELGDEDHRIGKLFEQLGCIDIIDESWVNHTMGKRYYHWDVTKNGVTETFYDTIYLDAGEQRVYEINY